MAVRAFLFGVSLFIFGCHLNSKVIGEAAAKGDLAFFIKLHEKGRLQQVLERYCGRDFHLSPLRVAIESDQIELLEFFLTHHYDCGSTHEIERLLEHSMYRENLRATRILFEHSGKSFTFEQGETLLKRERKGVISFLEEISFDFHVTDKSGNNLLGTMIEYGKTEMVKTLLAKGVDLYQKNLKGVAPIHRALANDELELVEYLLQINAHFEFPTNDGKTAKDFVNPNRAAQFKLLFDQYGKTW